MAIFDSNKKHYLSFFVHLTDADRVAELQAQYPDGVNRAPYDPGPPEGGAAIEFAAPWRGYDEPAASQAPFTWTPWRSDSSSGSNKPYPTNVATFQRTTGGFLGMGGTTVRYYWMGQFVLAGANAGDGDVSAAEEAQIPERNFIEGFETPGASPSPGHATGVYFSRDASRHVGGMGLAVRGPNNNYQLINLPVAKASSWERFYLRVRTLPASITIPFWRWTSGGGAQWLGITPSGQIAVYNISGSTSVLQTVITSVTLEEWTGRPDDDAWHRFDLLIEAANGGVQSRLRVYLDGAQVADVIGSLGTTHTGSRIGNNINEAAVANEAAYDVDDWVSSDIPSRSVDGSVVEALNGKDFTAGSKIVLVRPLAFDVDHDPGWTGDVRVLQQLSQSATNATMAETMTTTTASALCSVTTDSTRVVDADPGALGVASLSVHAWTKRGTTQGSLGYGLAGAAPVLTPLTGESAAAFVAQRVLFSNVTAVADGVEPELVDVTPIVLQYQKGADATIGTIVMLNAQVELVGKWNACDYTPTERATVTELGHPHTGQHNAPYPRSPWAQYGVAPPMSPYVVVGGTYVGNGTGQDLTFRAPVHWLFIRPLTGNLGGHFWLSSMNASHKQWQQDSSPHVALVEEDPTYAEADGEDVQQVQYRVRIAGGHTQVNASAVTYQYIAVCDPGMRYMLNQQAVHRNTLAAEDVIPMVSEGFLPDWAFIFGEGMNGSTTTNRMYAKGPGHAGTETIVGYAAGETADALNLDTAGQFTTRYNLHQLSGNFTHAFSFWRRSDGNNDTGEAAAVNIGSYIGDGSASRTVNLAPASGKRPLFAIVFPSNTGSGYHRDPSHTGSNSTLTAGTEGATGITSGGIDSFSVGSALNTNAVVYNYFVLFADETAGNNGWGTNGEYAPVEPTSPDDGPYPAEPPEPTDEEPEPSPGPQPTPNPFPGGPPNLPPDFGTSCYAYATYLGNVALSRIGVGMQIDDVRDDPSEEAYKIRLHYELDVLQVLRDHPWQFATKYADLVLVDGSEEDPVNKDWTYSYRAPSDMIFARRVVNPNGEKRAYDPDPPRFRVGRDTTGALIYCNLEAIDTDGDGTDETPVQLEYTYRPDCPASVGDAIFQSAFAWKLASSLALTLARDREKAAYCEEMYQRTLALARTKDVNEQQQDPDGDAAWITGR